MSAYTCFLKDIYFSARLRCLNRVKAGKPVDVDEGYNYPRVEIMRRMRVTLCAGIKDIIHEDGVSILMDLRLQH